jgi:hypothetical protein
MQPVHAAHWFVRCGLGAAMLLLACGIATAYSNGQLPSTTRDGTLITLTVHEADSRRCPRGQFAHFSGSGNTSQYRTEIWRLPEGPRQRAGDREAPLPRSFSGK